MIASLISLVVLALGLVSFGRATYMLGKDGVDSTASTRYSSFVAFAVTVVFVAAFLNKSLE
ncbi:MAG: hypothetical protein ACO35C_03950 [Pontimonas sp.]